MRQAGEDRHGLRVRAVIAVLWRGGLRISEALALAETDVDPARGSVLVRHGLGRPSPRGRLNAAADPGSRRRCNAAARTTRRGGP
jgi:integrase